MTDRFGLDIRGTLASIEAWNRAWSEFLHFTGDPVAMMTEANESDDEFAMGSVMAALYLITSGSPLEAAELRTHVDRARRRQHTAVERAHVAALDRLAAGDVTAAAEAWSALGVDGDFVAHRFAHDLYLHVGDADRRLHWGERADRRDWGELRHFVDGMHAFTLNEVGRFDEATEFGRRSLDADPLDLWARHALAHVYEDTAEDEASFELLRDTTDVWAGQDMLANHLWWHLALRLLDIGAVGDVLSIFDHRIPSSDTPFRLCDLSSLLWRTELAGYNVGDRWIALADTWDRMTERHTCGFLDLHASVTYLRCPDHPGASRWFAEVDTEPQVSGELREIFVQVGRPIVDAFRARDRGDGAAFHSILDRLGDETARIGGSNAQRHLITLTKEATPA